jgi:oxygen-dependent protoporphyrinogen oxidase
MSIPSVTVIGAGIAGLTAAYRLKQNGFSVKVLEALPSSGGRMTQLEEQGLKYNSGARLCYSFYSEIQKLIADLGIQNSIVKHGKMNIRCQTDLEQYSLPLNPNLDLLTNPVLSWSEKLALIRLLPDLIGARRRINPGWMMTAENFDEQTLEEYILEKVGPVFLEKFIEPVFRGTRSWNPEKISTAFFLSTAPFMMPGSFTFGFKNGIGQLTAELAKHLDIDYLAEVEIVERDSENNNCIIRYTVDGKPTELMPNIVVCAVEGGNVSHLVSEPVSEEVLFSMQ